MVARDQHDHQRSPNKRAKAAPAGTCEASAYTAPSRRLSGSSAEAEPFESECGDIQDILEQMTTEEAIEVAMLLVFPQESSSPPHLRLLPALVLTPPPPSSPVTATFSASSLTSTALATPQPFAPTAVAAVPVPATTLTAPTFASAAVATTRAPPPPSPPPARG